VSAVAETSSVRETWLNARPGWPWLPPATSKGRARGRVQCQVHAQLSNEIPHAAREPPAPCACRGGGGRYRQPPVGGPSTDRPPTRWGARPVAVFSPCRDRVTPAGALEPPAPWCMGAVGQDVSTFHSPSRANVSRVIMGRGTTETSNNNDHACARETVEVHMPVGIALQRQYRRIRIARMVG
jgi:hypothetical protein